MNKAFVSLFCYTLGKEASARGFNPDELVRLEVAAGERSRFGGFRTLYWLRTLQGDVIDDDMAFIAEHSTLIAKARSGCAAQFLASEADVWISIDDDASTGPRELALLIAAAAGHHLVVLPQLRRDGQGVNVHFYPDPPLEHELGHVRAGDDSARVVPIDFGGCSLMAVSRHAIEAMRDGYPELDCHRQPDRRVLALFLEEVKNAQWIGEDAMFFKRACGIGLVPKVLIDCETEHAGHVLPKRWFEHVKKAAP